MNKDEALKLALEALEAAEIDGNCEYGATEIIREALAQPAQRKPLTHEQIEAIFQESAGADEGTVERFARGIEFAHGIKENT
jgi:hypothetical protein